MHPALLVGAPQAPQGLARFYIMQAGANTQTIYDTSGGQHGVRGSMPSVDTNDPQWASPLGLQFDGLDDYCTLPSLTQAEMSGLGDLTFFTVASHFSGTNRFGSILDNKLAGSAIAGFNIQYNANDAGSGDATRRATIRVADGTLIRSIASTAALADGSPHFLAGRVDRGRNEFRAMFDDVISGSVSLTGFGSFIPASPQTFFLGTFSTGSVKQAGTTYLVGLIPWALSNSQLRQLRLWCRWFVGQRGVYMP